MPIVTISGLGAVRSVIVDGNGGTRPATISTPRGTALPVTKPVAPIVIPPAPARPVPPPPPAPIQLPPAAVPQPIVSAVPTMTATEAMTTAPAPAIPSAPDAATAAVQFAPGTEYINSSSGSVNIVPTPPTAADWITQAETWLQSSTMIPNVPNYWLVGGAILAGMLLAGGKRRR